MRPMKRARAEHHDVADFEAGQLEDVAEGTRNRRGLELRGIEAPGVGAEIPFYGGEGKRSDRQAGAGEALAGRIERHPEIERKQPILMVAAIAMDDRRARPTLALLAFGADATAMGHERRDKGELGEGGFRQPLHRRNQRIVGERPIRGVAQHRIADKATPCLIDIVAVVVGTYHGLSGFMATNSGSGSLA
jgi:hypothetical protein